MSGKIPDRNAAVVRILALFPDNLVKAALLGAAVTALPDELFQVREAYCSSFGLVPERSVLVPLLTTWSAFGGAAHGIYLGHLPQQQFPG